METKVKRKRWWLWVPLALLFCCCIVPEGCLTSYWMERYKTVEHPTKNVQATIFRSNEGAWSSFDYYIVVGIKGAMPYWRMSHVGARRGRAPEVKWVGDTLRVELFGSTKLYSSQDSVTTFNGHDIKIEVYKNGELVDVNP